MTATEMSREFDILYDNISSNASPGINVYEKSLFLTKAQDDLVRSHYSPYNTFQKGFESSENRRVELRELITPYSTEDFYIRDEGIDPDSKFFEIPDDVYYILQEQIQVTPDAKCGAKWIGVKPITHDEYNVSKSNPFRRPNARKAWRMDVEKQTPLDTGTLLPAEPLPVPMVEIITPFDVAQYKMRYIRKPRAIIVASFESDPETQGLELTVDGRNTTTECELNSEFHRLIVDRAVELAIRSYRENSLQANVELNNRNV